MRITKRQREVLYLITKEFLTPKQIQQRLKITKQAAYKHIRILRKKGLISPLETGVYKSQCTSKPYLNLSAVSKPNQERNIHNKYIRLHGQELNIKIISPSKHYYKRLDRVNTIVIDNNTVRLYRDSIEVYINKYFYGKDAGEATKESIIYLNRLLTLLENDLKIILVKHRYQNIKIVKAHYAEIENELAKECNINEEKIKVFASEDAKLWFTIDNSFNLNEAETQHPQTAKQDMQEVVQPFFNDLRDKQPPKTSEIWHILGELAKHELEQAAAVSSILALLKPKKPKEQTGIPDYFG